MPMSCVINAGRRHVMIPGWGIEITSPSAAAVAIQWYLSGGIAAANCIAAYTPKGAASLAASYDNNAAPGNGLADGTYDAAPGVAPTWGAATGWTFNGSTQYLDTGVVPLANTWSMIARFSGGQSSGDRFLCGIYVDYPAGYFGIWQISGGTSWYANAGAASTTYITSGVLGFAGKTGYKNGAADGAISAGALSTELTIFVGRAPELPYYYLGDIQAFAIYDTTLTAPQVAAVSAAMAAL